MTARIRRKKIAKKIIALQPKRIKFQSIDGVVVCECDDSFEGMMELESSLRIAKLEINKNGGGIYSPFSATRYEGDRKAQFNSSVKTITEEYAATFVNAEMNMEALLNSGLLYRFTENATEHPPVEFWSIRMLNYLMFEYNGKDSKEDLNELFPEYFNEDSGTKRSGWDVNFSRWEELYYSEGCEFRSLPEAVKNKAPIKGGKVYKLELI